MALAEGDNIRPILSREEKIITCPLCLGKGVCDRQYEAYYNKLLPMPVRRITDRGRGEPEPTASEDLPSVRQSQLTAKPSNFTANDHEKELTKIPVGNRRTRVSRCVSRPLSRSSGLQPTSTISTSSLPLQFLDNAGEALQSSKSLLRNLPLPDRPQEALKSALDALGNSNWERAVEGMKMLLSLARAAPAILEPAMARVYRALSVLLRGLRSHVTRLACQTTAELLQLMRSITRPELDELVGALLARTADMNKFIRRDANDALDSLVSSIPAVHCIRVLVFKGSGHKHPLVRAAASRLMSSCVTQMGPSVLGSSAFRDTRRMLLTAAAEFLCDGSQETRVFAKEMFHTFVRHADFDNIFASSVDSQLARRINKTLTLLKCQVRKNDQICKSLRASHESRLMPDSRFGTAPRQRKRAPQRRGEDRIATWT